MYVVVLAAFYVKLTFKISFSGVCGNLELRERCKTLAMYVIQNGKISVELVILSKNMITILLSCVKARSRRDFTSG